MNTLFFFMKKTSLVSGLIIGLSMITVAIAAPPGSPFNLGETLDPACAPGDPNCTVVAPAASGDNADITSLGSGNIGIGTTTPSELLELSADADADLDFYTANAGTDNSSIHFNYSRGTVAAPLIAEDADDIAAIDGNYYDGATYETAANIEFFVDGTPGLGDVPGSIRFNTTPDGTSSLQTRMVIEEDGDVEIRGTLGIGTTSANEKLVIQDDGDADIDIVTYEAGGTDNSTLHLLFANGTAAAPTAVIANETVGTLEGLAYNGSGFSDIARINFVSDGDIAADDFPGRIDFWTGTDNNGIASALIRRMEVDDDGEVTINPDTYDGDGEEFNIGEGEVDPGNESSDTAISMENSSFVYEIHVEDSNEFVIYEGNSENSGNSVLMYNGVTQHWGFGTDPTGAEITMDSGATLSAGGVWTDASSRDLKENIKKLSIKEALQALKGLEPVTFNYLDEADEEYLGFIAEDVPELVAKNDRKGLTPMDIVAVLTKVIQDQEERITTLEAQLQK
jgi:histone H3/H4